MWHTLTNHPAHQEGAARDETKPKEEPPAEKKEDKADKETKS